MLPPTKVTSRSTLRGSWCLQGKDTLESGPGARRASHSAAAGVTASIGRLSVAAGAGGQVSTGGGTGERTSLEGSQEQRHCLGAGQRGVAGGGMSYSEPGGGGARLERKWGALEWGTSQARGARADTLLAMGSPGRRLRRRVA